MSIYIQGLSEEGSLAVKGMTSATRLLKKRKIVKRKKKKDLLTLLDFTSLSFSLSFLIFYYIYIVC